MVSMPAFYVCEGDETLRIFNQLGWFFKQEWRRYVLGVVSLILVAIANVVPPRIIGLIIDAISRHRLTSILLASLLVLMVITAFVQYGLRFLWQKTLFGSSFQLERQLRSRLFDHFMAMDRSFYQRHRIGDLMAHATNDIDAVREVTGFGILSMADSLITGGSMIFAMGFFVSWRLTLVAILPLLAVMAKVLGDKVHVAFDKSQAAFSDLNNKTQESVMGVKVIKTLGENKSDEKDFDHHVKRTIRTNRHAYMLDAMFNPVATLIMGASYVLIIIFGGQAVIHQQITIGQLVTFITYLAQLAWPMYAIGMLFNTLERGSASYDRIDKLLQEQSALKPATTDQAEPPRGQLTANIIRFKYPDGDGTALHDVHFTLRPGESLGLVGPTGGGKSTILRLLLRDFDRYTGEIMIDHQDIRSFSPTIYRKLIGYVPQTSFLFSTTIRKNIAFADVGASLAKVRAAAKVAAIDQDIEQMPAGYDTAVGELGVSLSGGQKQRLAIARAVLTDPQLLVMDDALSAVDAKTERQIEDRLHQVRQNQSTIIAASRLSSVQHLDRIMVVAGGTVVEQGTHNELMANHGWYYETFTLQERVNDLKRRLENE